MVTNIIIDRARRRRERSMRFWTSGHWSRPRQTWQWSTYGGSALWRMLTLRPSAQTVSSLLCFVLVTVPKWDQISTLWDISFHFFNSQGSRQQLENFTAALQAPEMPAAAADRAGGWPCDCGRVGEGRLPAGAGHHRHWPEHCHHHWCADPDTSPHLALCWSAGWDEWWCSQSVSFFVCPTQQQIQVGEASFTLSWF